MKKLLLLALSLCLVLPCVTFLSACGGEEAGPSGSGRTLYVYNWGEYISDGSDDSFDVNKGFEEWYFENYGEKVTVNYSTFSSNEDMYGKLSAGVGGYDVVIPSDYTIALMIENTMLRKINFDNVPAIENIDYDRIFGEGGTAYYDPTGEYSVPYTYGTVGIIYNTQYVDEEDIGSWDLMWNEKYAGNILQFNNPRDAFMTAQKLLGQSVNSHDAAEWEAALAKLKEEKQNENGTMIVQGYVMDEIFNIMENGSAAIAPYYAGDYFTMYGENEDLAFFYPKEGTNVFVDAMCIPVDSPNPDLAEAYINYMLLPEAAIANAEYICYASPNKLVADDPEYIECMEEIHPDALDILYGTSDIEMEFYENLPEEDLNRMNDLWEDLKIESNVSVVLLGIAIGIVALLVLLLLFFLIRKQVRRKAIKNLWK